MQIAHLLEPLLQTLDLALQALGIGLALTARSEPGNVCLSGLRGSKQHSASKGAQSNLADAAVLGLSPDNHSLAAGGTSRCGLQTTASRLEVRCADPRDAC